MAHPLTPELRDWLLDTDVALRWQVERDLVEAPQEVWESTRARVATEGFGAELLAHQDPDGQWAGGAFFPRGFDFDGPEAAAGAGQPWTATTWSLNALREWGLDSMVLDGTAAGLAANSRWEYNDGPYWEGEVDCCINASTLNSLKGILYDEAATGGSDELNAARHGGEEYLLQRRLLKSLTTGEILGPRMTRLVYPFRSFYSALNAADYFRSASLFDGTPPDPRLSDAIESVRVACQPDGTWLQERRHPGRVWFEVDVEAGKPSPWLTFCATRVLAWWDASSAMPSP